IIYMNESTPSPNPSFDCGLACQNMVIAANALGYGTKIVSSPTMTLNGDNHDELCELLGVDSSLTAVAVLLVGYQDTGVDGVTSSTTRYTIEEKVSFVE
ncbi:MAG: nitroreductase family protein, partial [Clostridia bacterium]|nr:nitroreductase family protein [Clostridia bacterium]